MATAAEADERDRKKAAATNTRVCALPRTDGKSVTIAASTPITRLSIERTKIGAAAIHIMPSPVALLTESTDQWCR